MKFHKYSGLSLEASYRFDERLAILGVIREPTLAQYQIAYSEAIEFDRETIRRRMKTREEKHELQS